MSDIDKIMRMAPVIPVLVIDDIHDARPVAEALVAGGLKVLEVTLRTPIALDVIRRMNLVPGAIVGAGTVTTKEELDQAVAAGAEFIVSPGLTESVVKAATRAGVPILPGVSDASDIMRGIELGLSHFKFFPAAASGGIPALKALAAPFYKCKFCPTGGIGPDDAADWLALDPVLCVGGSWVAPQGVDPATIRKLAEDAKGLAA